MIRLGLVGAGRWGKNYVEAAKQAGNCEVEPLPRDVKTAVMDRLDGLVVATPPDAILGYACSALTRNKSVMLEKPIALSVDGTEFIEEVAKQHNGLVLVNHQHLFAPAYEELYQRVQDLPHIQIATYGGDCKPAHDWPWLWDWAPHDVSMVLDLGGPSPRLASVWEDGESVFCRWQTQRGSAFSHIGVNFPEKRRRLKVNDHGLSLVYDDRAEHKLVSNGQPVEVSPELPLTRSLRAFAQAVAAGGTEDRRFGARWGVSVAQQIEAIGTFATRPNSR